MELSRIGIYQSTAEANLVKARLEFNGIQAIVQSDSASGAVPQLEAYSGVLVFVREDDLAEAMEVLERMLPRQSDV